MPSLKPKYVFSVLRGLTLRARFGSRVRFDLLRTYFGPGFELIIVGDGRLHIDSSSDRVYFSRDCAIACSNGTLTLGAGVFFNRGCNITSHERIEIGPDCLFGPNVSVYDSDHVFSDLTVPFRRQGYAKKPVSIGANCWLGVNAVITKGTTIGANTVIGANSVVRGEIRAASLYAGQPARFIRSLEGALQPAQAR